MEAIESIPSVHSGDCEVYVNDGVVTLSGKVHSYSALFDIECHISQIAGIHGIQTYIQTDVRPAEEQRRAVSDRRCSARDRRLSRPD